MNRLQIADFGLATFEDEAPYIFSKCGIFIINKFNKAPRDTWLLKWQIYLIKNRNIQVLVIYFLRVLYFIYCK